MASRILPEAFLQTKIIPATISAEMLRAMGEAFEAAMSAPAVIVPKAQRIGELAGAVYCGPQVMDFGTFHYFREPVTGTSLCVRDRDLSVSFLQDRMKDARVRFGVEVQS